MVIKIVLNERGVPASKLADVELHFEEGALAGLKLIGFAVWERKRGVGRTITFPARQYTTAGERRSFTLLRPIADIQPQDRLRETILQAFVEFEAQTTVAR